MGVSMDTVSTASGLLKQVYSNGVVDALPDNELISQLVGYQRFEKIGQSFTSAVNLSYGHSVTAMGPNDQNLSLGVPVIVPIQNATAVSYVFVYRDMISTTILQRAVSAGPQAFESAAAVAMERATKSFTKIQEEELNYGQKGIGQFVGATSYLNLSQVQITYAEFAPGIWVASKDMPIDIYTTAGVKVLSTTVTAMADITNRVLTLASVTGLVNGTTYNIFRQGFYGLEAPGLHVILDNATSLFGIPSDGTYDLWAPNLYNVSASASSPLVFSRVARGVALFRPKGLAKDLTLVVAEDTFVDAIPDYNTTVDTNANPGARSSRVFMTGDDTYKLMHGTAELKFTINTTSVSIKSSPYQKNGYAPLIEADSLIRIGSSEKAFTIQELGGAGTGANSEYFRVLENLNAYEFRLSSDISLFTSERNRSMLFTGIVNNTPA
jgi:hypothetical protein